MAIAWRERPLWPGGLGGAKPPGGSSETSSVTPSADSACSTAPGSGCSSVPARWQGLPAEPLASASIREIRSSRSNMLRARVTAFGSGTRRGPPGADPERVAENRRRHLPLRLCRVPPMGDAHSTTRPRGSRGAPPSDGDAPGDRCGIALMITWQRSLVRQHLSVNPRAGGEGSCSAKRGHSGRRRGTALRRLLQRPRSGQGVWRRRAG